MQAFNCHLIVVHRVLFYLRNAKMNGVNVLDPSLSVPHSICHIACP